MPKFTFKAKNTANELIEGTRSASSDKELVASLRDEGLVVFSITELREELTLRRDKVVRKAKSGGSIKAQDVAVFCRQLATLINAGVSILDAVDDISEMVPNVRFQKILKQVSSDIREGSTLSDAMKKHQKVFGRIFVSMIAAGEKSGKLGKVLVDLSGYLEDAVKLKRKVVSASAYPAFIGVFFVFILIAIMLFLVPRLKALYGSFGATLPLPTQIVISISTFLMNHFLIMAGVVAALIFAAVSFYKTTPGKMLMDNMKLKAPVFGPIITKVVFARLFQALATLLKSGVDIISSLEIAARVTGNLPVETIMSTVKGRIVEGSTLSQELERVPLFPKMVVRMIAVGEKSGKLDDMSEKLSDYYNDEVDAAVSVLSSIIEPLLIILLGFVVGIVVVTLYLPIFKLGMAMMGGQ